MPVSASGESERRSSRQGHSFPSSSLGTSRGTRGTRPFCSRVPHPRRRSPTSETGAGPRSEEREGALRTRPALSRPGQIGRSVQEPAARPRSRQQRPQLEGAFGRLAGEVSFRSGEFSADHRQRLEGRFVAVPLQFHRSVGIGNPQIAGTNTGRSLGAARRRFDEVESELASEWESTKGNSRLAWNDAKSATRAAWHRVERAMPGDADNDGR